MVFKYLKSQSGRKLMVVLAGTTTVSLFCVNYIPHTFGLDQYKKFIQCYQNATPVQVSENVIKRFNEAADILDIDKYEQSSIQPFSVFGFDLFTAGSTKSRFGGILGIPFNYEYNSADDIKRSEVRFRDKEVNWNAESGKLLEEALILTHDEQVFGFCKMILQLQTNYVLLNSIFPSVSFLMVYTVGNYLNSSLNLFVKPASIRLFMYSILGLFGLGSWSFMKDYNQVVCDTDIDKKLSSINPKYTRAGINFYDKQLKKNMALKDLLNDNTFTAKGNLNYILRQKSLPLTVRKSFFEHKQKEYEAALVN